MGKILLLSCLCFALIVNVIGTYTATHYTIPCDTKQLAVSLTLTNPLFVSDFHCVGEYDTYFELNAPATTDSTEYPWNATLLYSTSPYMNLTGFVNYLYVARNNYNGICAEFDLVTYDNEDDFNTFYVLPSNPVVTAKLAEGGKSGSISWTKTGNPQDTYELYWANTQTAPAGQNFATACSVKAWMKPFTSDNGAIKDNGDNTMTATVKNLNPNTPFNIVVVANRGNNTISGVYDSIALNGKKSDGSALLPSMMLAVVVILAMLW
eukprot:Phypoly_transcript_14316.p1 GENE.Phypoly_transcript_14316~~Phypoly_transcript_14316.p1  ORF type:complete len:265 (+),score=38.63 Phypoly_transcript_14316:92-886(+)